MCPDCKNTGFITAFTTRKRCARCVAAKADELINKVIGTKPVPQIGDLHPGDYAVMIHHFDDIIDGAIAAMGIEHIRIALVNC